MKKVLFLGIILAAISISANAQTPAVCNGDFEDGWDCWSTDNGVWQIGSPTAGPGGCYEGSSQCAGTVLDGNYSTYTDSRLISYHVVLPTVAGSEEIHLRFQNWFSYSTSDSGQVQVSVWDGASWGAWVNEGIPLVNTSAGWSVKDVDLTAYAGQTIRMAFYHMADYPDESTGWYIDDLRIVIKTPEFSGDFEAGWDDWSAERGLWQIGIPTTGPGGCYEGSQCAGTVLDGNYPTYTDSRLISATMVLPTVAGSEELHLRFQNWFSYSTSDSGQVQVSVWDGASWGAWVNEGIPLVNTSAGWSVKDVDLTAYAGQTIRMAFYHIASYPDESTGWYIDDLRIVVKTPEFSGDFEAGWDDWSAERGLWQIGIPTTGPGGCYEGSQCAGTVLDGNYPTYTDSRLISATMVLPTVAGSEELHLRFQNWFSYSTSDSGQVQVSVWDGASWGAWVNEGIPLIDTSAGWSVKDVDLTAYAGQTIRIAFYHTANYPDNSTGWYIDDLRIVVKTPEFTGDFETGWEDWSAERGVWQIGVPTAGPDACYEGEQCAGTVLGGNYPTYTDSRLIAATKILPIGTGPEGVWLRFQTWFSYSTSDSGQVQVSVWDDTEGWRNWDNVGTPVSGVSGGWSLIHIDLTPYSGKTVRIAFYHKAVYPDNSTGWYIDNLIITGDDDNDGVGNDSDDCPGTPEGVSVDANGCSNCQNDPTLPGCPAADDDGDGVINELDECPSTPPGASVNDKGCSAQFQVQILDVDTTECPTIQARLIVTDINGNVISNLTEANFEAYVSATLQTPITVQYVDQTSFPVATSLALDYSGSMGTAAIADMEAAAVAFINQLAAGDTGEIIKFANGIETAQSYTSNKADLIAAVYADTALSTSKTKFYDAVYQAITDTSLQPGRKAVIAMTDGQDNASSHSAADVILHAQSSEMPVFTIGLGKSVNTAILRSIAEQTGGLYYESPDSSDLASIYQAISIVLKNQYLITFNSSYRDGQSHPLTIMATDGALFGSDEETFTVCSNSGSGGTSRDFDGDGKPDILWRNASTGDNYIWYMDGVTVRGGGVLPTVADQNWKIVGVTDLNNDDKPDILWRHAATGDNYVWYLNGVTVQGGGNLPTVADQNWNVVGIADFNNDNKPDILWRHAATGDNYVWYLDGVTVQGGGVLPTVADQNWKVVGVADFNNDSRLDVLWRHAATGDNYVWYLDGVAVQGGGGLPMVADQNWKVVRVDDFNNDEKPDILWRHAATGDNYVWYLDGVAVQGGGSLPMVADQNWTIVQ